MTITAKEERTCQYDAAKPICRASLCGDCWTEHHTPGWPMVPTKEET